MTDRFTVYPEMDLEKALELNPNMELTSNKALIDVIVRGIIDNKSYCPCVPKYNHNESTACPCDKMLNENTCHCGIFVEKNQIK